MTPDQLPAEAKRKLAAIEQSAADAQALFHSMVQRAKQAEGRVLAAGQVLDTHPSEPRLQEVLAELAAAKDEVQDLRQQQAGRMERHAALAQVATRLKTFLQELPADTPLEAVTPEVPDLRGGESPTAAIQRIRAEVQAAQRDLLDVKAAPLPLADVKAEAAAFVQELARLGTPTVSVDRGQFRPSWWGWSPGQPSTLGPAHLMQIAAWLDPERFTERLMACVAELPAPKLALSQADRTRASVDLTTRIDALELQEESLIEQALAAGQDVLRRPQASPLAILGVRVAQRQAVAA